MTILRDIIDKIFGHRDASERDILDKIFGHRDASEPKPAEPFDIEASLNERAVNVPYRLDWKHSVVDLMKLLDLDSSFARRRQLALELGYTGDLQDSADMNRWLHQQIMRAVADNGGKVPGDLL